MAVRTARVPSPVSPTSTSTTLSPSFTTSTTEPSSTTSTSTHTLQHQPISTASSTSNSSRHSSGSNSISPSNKRKNAIKVSPKSKLHGDKGTEMTRGDEDTSDCHLPFPEAQAKGLNLDGSTSLEETFATATPPNKKPRISYHNSEASISLPYLTIPLIPKTSLKSKNKPDEKNVEQIRYITILLDCASSANFVTRNALELLPHKFGKTISTAIKTLRGITKEKLQQVKITVKTTEHDSESLGQEFDFDCLVLDKITCTRSPFQIEQLPSTLKPGDFNLAPPNTEIDLLIGCTDFFKLLISHSQLTPEVFIVKTSLGTTLAGLNSGKLIRSDLMNHVETHSITNEQLDSLVQRYWKVEKLPGDEILNLTGEEHQALEFMKDTTTYDSKTKRFTVRHIFKEEPQILNNVIQARGQWNSLERKLKKDPTTAKLYAQHFREGLDDGIFVEASRAEAAYALNPANRGVHWLIHFPVLRPGHSSTPCRPVFSPSAPTPCPPSEAGERSEAGDADTSSTSTSTTTSGSKQLKGRQVTRKKGRTLNDHILPGPNFLSNIPVLTLSFRTGKYVVMADVKRQFHQLLIHKDDQRWGYFFYKDPLDASAELKVYKIVRTYFGLRCAPAQAGFAMRKIAQMEKEKYPDDKEVQEASLLLLQKNYADDYIMSMNDENWGIVMVRKMQEILAEGSFSLCKFVSNSLKILQSIPEHLRAPLNQMEMHASQDSQLPLSDEAKVLGLTYSAQKDAFILEYSNFEGLMALNKNTRRSMLKILATLAYDVLGARTPFILKGRVLLQQSYIGKEVEIKEKDSNNKPVKKKQMVPYKWDEVFQEPLLSKWEEYVSLIPQLLGFELPRLLPTTFPYKIIVMSDASNTCTAAAAWIVWQQPTSKNSKKKFTYDSRLIMSRGKVRALKDKDSIARAELNGLMLARDLVLCIQEAFQCTFNTFSIFTDSMVCWFWTRLDSSRLGVYQKNRVEKLQELKIEIQYVCSEMNGADPIAKTANPDYLKSDAYLRGPPWIRQDSKYYPKDGPILAKELHKMSPQEKKNYLDGFRSQQIHVNLVDTNVINTVAPVAIDDNPFFEIMSHYSKLDKVLMIMAIIYRFIHRCRNGFRTNSQQTLRTRSGKTTKSTDPVTAERFGLTLSQYKQKALLFLVKLTQHRYFLESIKSLKKDETVPKGDPLYRLVPFLCEKDGCKDLIRLNTRLTYSRTKSFNCVYPLVLPSHGPLTRLLVLDSHYSFFHATELCMKKHLRTEFWIIRADKLIRSVVKNCIPCNKSNSRALTDLMSPLSAERVNLLNTYPLQTLHVDVFGPFRIKNEWMPTMKDKKVWILGCICVKTNFLIALPIYKLDLDTLLLTLQTLQSRYCSRVKKILSDNAQTFKAADTEVRKFFQDNENNIEILSARMSIEWSFSPTYSPWANGIIERNGGLLKKALMTAMGNKTLGHLNFEALLAACCCMCNQRPLLPITNNSGHYILSPSQLVFGDYSCHYLPNIADSTTKREMAQKWRERKEIYLQFKQVWLNNYLDYISRRVKWHDFRQGLKENDIVLVKMPSPDKKKDYPLALVTKIFDSKDGAQRMCEVRYANTKKQNENMQVKPGDNYTYEGKWQQKLGFDKKNRVERCSLQRIFPLEGSRNSELHYDALEKMSDDDAKEMQEAFYINYIKTTPTAKKSVRFKD